MMKGFLKITNIILIIIIIYLFIGNLYRGITAPTLIGNSNGHFLGYYLIALAYFVLLIIMFLINFIFVKKRKKSK